eukprot:Nitzschia sp. Nitz4//scaffold1_size375055//369358//369741//NITZ4_000346-RA/size375055-processed-gene-0.93-mRNA-1//1//CDS//3329541255//34//frame0
MCRPTQPCSNPTIGCRAISQRFWTQLNVQQPLRICNDLPVLQKKRFVLFMKIFMDTVHAADEEAFQKARMIVADCTRRNRLGDPKYTPLMDAVQRRLRKELGETHWRRARMGLRQIENRLQRATKAL